VFISRYIMNLYEKDRRRRAAGEQQVRQASTFAGATATWKELAERRELAFDEDPLPQMRGLFGGQAFELATSMDQAGIPFMIASVTTTRPSSLQVVPSEWYHRLMGRKATGDADFDAAYSIFGKGAPLVGPSERETLSLLHYRSPRLMWKGNTLRADLDGVELDPDLLERFLDLLRGWATSATDDPPASHAYRD